MIRLIIFLLLAYLVYRAVKPAGESRTLRGSTENKDRELPIDDEMVKDPICSTFVPKHEAVPLHRGGRTYYFCSPACRERFVQGNEPPAAGDAD